MARNVYTDLDFLGSSRPVNIPSPVNPGDAANKGYVDSALEGLSWKDSVRVATQANVNLAAPGATIDGITMAAQDRFLARAQTTDRRQNGIYIWNGAAVPATRALDASTFAELEQAVVLVEEGTSAGTSFRQDQINGTIDSSSINWVSFGAGAPPASETTPGIVENATQAETDAGTDDLRFVSPLKLANWSGRMRKFSANIGDGSATSFTVTHNLNSLDCIVNVFLNSTGAEVITDVNRTSANSVQVVFNTPPANNAFRVVVMR